MSRAEVVLSDIFYNPNSPACFSNIDAVYKEAHHRNLPQITRGKVKQFLQSQSAYTRHKEVRRNFKRDKIWAFGIFHTWFADLHSIESIRWQNHRKRFLLGELTNTFIFKTFSGGTGIIKLAFYFSCNRCILLLHVLSCTEKQGRFNCPDGFQRNRQRSWECPLSTDHRCRDRYSYNIAV